METPNLELMSALSTLLDKSKYSDLTIICRDQRYAVHRAIICSRSDFFDGACSHAFREASTGTIDLSEDDPVAVEHMVTYFYHLDYLRQTDKQIALQPTPLTYIPSGSADSTAVEDPLLAQAAASSLYDRTRPFPREAQSEHDPPHTYATSKTGGPSDETASQETNLLRETKSPIPEANREEPNLSVHAKVYAIAEKYNIKALKTLAQTKFTKQASVHYASSDFCLAIQDVYESTVDSDRGLRDAVIHTFRAHPELATKADIEEAVKQTPSLAWELFRVGWGLPIN